MVLILFCDCLSKSGICGIPGVLEWIPGDNTSKKCSFGQMNWLSFDLRGSRHWKMLLKWCFHFIVQIIYWGCGKTHWFEDLIHKWFPIGRGEYLYLLNPSLHLIWRWSIENRVFVIRACAPKRVRPDPRENKGCAWALVRQQRMRLAENHFEPYTAAFAGLTCQIGRGTRRGAPTLTARV